MCLAHTCRAKEKECTDGLRGVFESDAVALYSLDNLLNGIVLAYNLRFTGTPVIMATTSATLSSSTVSRMVASFSCHSALAVSS